MNYPILCFDLIWQGTLDVGPLASGYLVAGMTGATAFAGLTQSTLAGFSYTQGLSFKASQIQPGTILAIKTTTGKYSKVLITALPCFRQRLATRGIGRSGRGVATHIAGWPAC